MTEQQKRNYPNIAQSFGITGIAILGMLIFSPIMTIITKILGKEPAFLIYYLFAMGVPFFIVNRIRIKKVGIINSRFNVEFSSIKIILLVLITIIAIQTGIISPIVGSLPMPDFMKKIFLELAEQTGIFSFITIVIAAPVLEELIFRGIILKGLLTKYTPIKSIIISSLLFGIVHLNPWQFIGAMVIGVFSGWIYYKTQKLTLSIIIHMANNLFAFISMSFMTPETMFEEKLVDIYGGGIITYMIITIGALIITGIGIYILNKDFEDKEKTKGNTQHAI
jgi:membrane protease YdiL (CAAX protease family)